MQELEGKYAVAFLVFDTVERVFSLYDGGFAMRCGVLCTGVVRYDLSYLCSLSLQAAQKHHLSPALLQATGGWAAFGVLDGELHLDVFARAVEWLCLFVSVLECISFLQFT